MTTDDRRQTKRVLARFPATCIPHHPTTTDNPPALPAQRHKEPTDQDDAKRPRRVLQKADRPSARFVAGRLPRGATSRNTLQCNHPIHSESSWLGTGQESASEDELHCQPRNSILGTLKERTRSGSVDRQPRTSKPTLIHPANISSPSRSLASQLLKSTRRLHHMNSSGQGHQICPNSSCCDPTAPLARPASIIVSQELGFHFG